MLKIIRDLVYTATRNKFTVFPPSKNSQKIYVLGRKDINKKTGYNPVNLKHTLLLSEYHNQGLLAYH